MLKASLSVAVLVVLYLFALPKAHARKADTLWTKHQGSSVAYLAPVLSPDDRLVGAEYLMNNGNGGKSGYGFVFWDLRTGAEVWRLPTVDGPPDWMRFTPDAKSVIVYRSRGYEKIDLAERTSLAFETDGDTSDYPGEFRINDISADGRLFLSTKRKWNEHTIHEEITLWDVATGRIVRTVKIPGLDVCFRYDGVLFSADTNRLLVFTQLSGTGRRGQWQVFDIPTGTLTPLAFSSVGVTYGGDETRIILSPDKTRIAAYEPDPTYPQNRKGIRILDGYTFATIATLPSGLADPGRLYEGGFTRDNSTYISSADRFEVWDIASTRAIDTINCKLWYGMCGENLLITADKRYLVGNGFVIDRSIDTPVSHVGEQSAPPVLYPNPSTHSVHVRTAMAMHPGFDLEIIPVTSGQSISYDPTLLRRMPDELVVDVSSLASGTYLFRLRAPGVEPVAVKVAVRR